ncbi:MAG: anti-sigma factor family protein [Betaproteobacteria bacterium]
MICDDVERDIDLYVDRELQPDVSAAIRDHLGTCEACRKRVAEREALGHLIRTAPYYPASDRLRASVSSRANRARSTRRVLAWAAAAVLAVSVGALSLVQWSRTRLGDQMADATAEEVVSGHVRSLMAEHLFDVRSTDQHTVKPWFLGRLDFSPPVTDLAAIGFPLVGGRLDYVAGRPAAALVYQRQKHTINLFVWPAAAGDTAAATRSIHGFHAHHWVRGGMSFWAVSDLNDAELTDFVRALQRAS